jgi:hypothetical protein
MKVRVMGRDYEGVPVCEDCGKKHYPHPEKYKWLCVVDEGIGNPQYLTVPVAGNCAHCGKLRMCALRLTDPKQEEISVTE